VTATEATPVVEERPPVIAVKDLKVRFHTDDGVVRAVDGVTFELRAGHTLGLVGESGSGKSVTSLALMRLLDPQMTELEGSVSLDGRDLFAMSASEVRARRGREIAMIFQDPMTSLNPFLRVGRQLTEVLQIHEGLGRRAAKKRCIEMLERVGIGDAARRFGQYPHQFSGGMRQRVMIAMALLCKPKVLIADEPTTALDVTIQAQILDLIRELSRDLDTAVLFITHDLGVIAGLADEVAVMYAGRIVERGDTDSVLGQPSHPYTKALLRSVPRLEAQHSLEPVPGSPPLGSQLPSGCAFHPRCSEARESCANETPGITRLGPSHTARCPFTDAPSGAGEG
jgi:oligopeptide/dipeptide ABC transporter ATP-binding protein